MDILYHGHSCFELSDGETRVLVDPFLIPSRIRAHRERLRAQLEAEADWQGA